MITDKALFDFANAEREMQLVSLYPGSMSRAPYALPKPEKGFATGHQTVYDTTLGWRFVNPRMEEMGYTDSLGMTAENLAQERFQLTPEEPRPEEVAGRYDISRERQDRFALRSHQKAVAAQDTKRFCDEIVPVTVRTLKSEPLGEVVRTTAVPIVRAAHALGLQSRPGKSH